MLDSGLWTLDFGLRPQDQPSGDLIGRLLGIDKVDLSQGQWSISWASTPPLWLMVLVVIPAIAALVWFIYHRERSDVPRGPKLLLTGLRSALLLLVVLLLLGPRISVEIRHPRKSQLIFMIDDSLSMLKQDPPYNAKDRTTLALATGMISAPEEALTPAQEDELMKLPRIDVVRRVLANPRLNLLAQIKERLNIRFVAFSRSARELNEDEDPLALAPSGTETALGDSIRQALAKMRGQQVDAIIVVSDGQNNSGTDPLDVATEVGRYRRIPIFTIAPGVSAPHRNIRLTELQARNAVLAEDRLELKFRISAVGLEGQPADLQLYSVPLEDARFEAPDDPAEIEKLLQDATKELEQRVTLGGNDDQKSETLHYQPRKPGNYLLVLKTPKQEGETSERDNYLFHRLRVADDKIRVLLVDHFPRWEFRYLKNSLIRDPKILVHCLQTSADIGHPQDHSLQSDDPKFRESLKEFPATLKELLEYDVLILGDVELQRIGGMPVAEMIKKFVGEHGGGLIFMSGELYNPRTYPGTPLAGLLPVYPEESRGGLTDTLYDRTYGYKLTNTGRIHEIILNGWPELSGNLDAIVEHWEDLDRKNDGLVGIRWFSPVRGIKPNAHVLVEVTGTNAAENKPPLFVTMSYSAGRVFWSGTDETWLWRYIRGDSPWLYPFWRQAMYWTRQGKILGASRYRISVDKEIYRQSEGVHIFANAYDSDFEPLKDEHLTVHVEPPEGKRIDIPLLKDKQTEGYLGEWTPVQPGRYRIWAGEDDENTRAYAQFTVHIPNLEESSHDINVENLKKLAEVSQSDSPDARPVDHFYPLDRVHQLPKDIERSDMSFTERKEDDLWDSPLVYLLFALLITAEWILRKVFRML